VPLELGVLVFGLVHECRVSTVLSSLAVGGNDRGYKFVQVFKYAADRAETDSAGQLNFLTINLEPEVAYVIDQLAGPGLRIARTASLQQRHDGSAFKSSGDIPRVHALANFFREKR